MSLLTEQEIDTLAEKHLHTLANKPYFAWFDYARAIEAKVIAKIKAQGPSAWLHCERKDADVVTDAVKHVWGKAVVGSLALYNIPLYKLPEGE